MSQIRNHKGNKKIPEANENKSARYQNSGNAVKEALRGKLVALDAYIIKQERSQ